MKKSRDEQIEYLKAQVKTLKEEWEKALQIAEARAHQNQIQANEIFIYRRLLPSILDTLRTMSKTIGTVTLDIGDLKILEKDTK